MSMAKLKP